jgi:uncharacterized protein YjiS (DUF1127 family)
VATITHGQVGHSVSDIAGKSTGRSLFSRLVAFLQERRARAETMDALNMLDDRDLRDLHINAYDFKSISEGSFRN